MKRFWYVYSRAGEKPLHRHKTIESAINEAIRLSKENKRNFYVLQPSMHIVWDKKNECCVLDYAFYKDETNDK